MKHLIRTLSTGLAFMAAMVAAPALSADHSAHHPAASSDAASAPGPVASTGATGGLSAQVPADLADGEVRKIDAVNNKITLKHGEIKNINMPGMTMVFHVNDPALLTKVQVGEKVRFAAEKSSKGYVVTYLTPVP